MKYMVPRGFGKIELEASNSILSLVSKRIGDLHSKSLLRGNEPYNMFN